MNFLYKKCKKSLYKSTYKGYAFTKNKKYIIKSEDKDYIYLIDNQGNIFDMYKNPSNIYYYFNDYFNI